MLTLPPVTPLSQHNSISTMSQSTPSTGKRAANPKAGATAAKKQRTDKVDEMTPSEIYQHLLAEAGDKKTLEFYKNCFETLDAAATKRKDAREALLASPAFKSQDIQTREKEIKARYKWVYKFNCQLSLCISELQDLSNRVRLVCRCCRS